MESKVGNCLEGEEISGGDPLMGNMPTLGGHLVLGDKQSVGDNASYRSFVPSSPSGEIWLRVTKELLRNGFLTFHRRQSIILFGQEPCLNMASSDDAQNVLSAVSAGPGMDNQSCAEIGGTGPEPSNLEILASVAGVDPSEPDDFDEVLRRSGTDTHSQVSQPVCPSRGQVESELFSAEGMRHSQVQVESLGQGTSSSKFRSQRGDQSRFNDFSSASQDGDGFRFSKFNVGSQMGDHSVNPERWHETRYTLGETPRIENRHDRFRSVHFGPSAMTDNFNVNENSANNSHYLSAYREPDLDLKQIMGYPSRNVKFVNNSGSKPKEPPIFDGRSCWTDYQVQFEMINFSF